MHYTLTKNMIFVSVFFMLAIAGCSVTKPDVGIQEKNYETDTSEIDVQMPEFKNFSDTEFEEKLNSNYNNAVDKWVEDFLKECSKNPSQSEKYIFRLTQSVKYDTAPFISLVGDIYIFTEGVHGTSSRIVKNIDTQKNMELKLADLFSDESYPDVINREIAKILESNPEEYHDLWEKPILSSMHQEMFYLAKEGLVIFYPPYELSYYARGFVEFCIPYSEISGYLKSEYKILANK